MYIPFIGSSWKPPSVFEACQAKLSLVDLSFFSVFRFSAHPDPGSSGSSQPSQGSTMLAPEVDLPASTSSSSPHLAPPSPSDIGVPFGCFDDHDRDFPSPPPTPTQGQTYNDKYVVLYDFANIGAISRGNVVDAPHCWLGSILTLR